MDTNDMFKISCPVCGSVIHASKKVNYQGKGIRCPICKELSPFSAFKIIGGYGNDDTQYGGGDETKYGGNDKTELGGGNTEYPPGHNKIGSLVDLSTGTRYKLVMGRNVVGRQSSQPQATILIPCQDNHMSRQHVIIQVGHVKGKGVNHSISLAKERINATYLDGARGLSKLEFGDEVDLEDGMVIKLPGRNLRFEL